MSKKKIVLLAVAGVLVASVIASAASSGSSSSKSSGGAKSTGYTGPKVPGTLQDSFWISGDKEAARNLSYSGVWCRWSGSHVYMRIAFRNGEGAHVTVHVQPNYRLANAGQHGSGLTSVKDVGIDAGAFRAWFADLGSPEGVKGHPPISQCAPEINGVDLG